MAKPEHNLNFFLMSVGSGRSDLDPDLVLGQDFYFSGVFNTHIFNIVQLFTYFQVKKEKRNDFISILIIFARTNWTKLFRQKTIWSLAAKKSNCIDLPILNN